MKTKEIQTLRVVACTPLSGGNYLLRLAPQEGSVLPAMQAGQFVQVLPPGGMTLLRRPISVCNVEAGELWLLVARVGRGTVAITSVQAGDTLSLVLPLGNTFDLSGAQRPLLVGGGVGIAPMLMLAKTFASRGIRPVLLMGGRTSAHIPLVEELSSLGDLLCTTEDGSLGYQGRVTEHPLWQEGGYDSVYTCGPMPMMRAVAALALGQGIRCQVSLENMMACGIGTCLCCVQDTVSHGNLCVCTEGPVFDAREIKW